MLLRNIKAVLLSSVLVQIIIFISTFIVRRFIEPNAMGTWNLVTIYTRYIHMFNFGTTSAAQRQIPYYLGKGETEKEKKVRETFFSVIFIEIAFASLIYLIYLFTRENQLTVNYWFLYFLAPFFALTTRFYDAMIVVFQSRQEFVALSKQNVYISISQVVFTVIGAWTGNIVGLFIGYAILYMFRIYLNIRLARNVGVRFTFKFHPEVFKELFKLGVPMEIAGYLWGIFVTIDSLLVAKWLGVAPLAFYAIGIAFSRQLGDFPTQINSVLYPRIMQNYGKNKDFSTIKNDINIFFIGNLLVLIPFLYLAGSFLCPFLIRTFINDYSPAIIPLQILLLTIFTMPQLHILFNIFSIKKQMLNLILFNGAALVITALSVYLFYTVNGTLWSVAAGVAVGYFIFFLFLFFVSTQNILHNYERIKILISLIGTICFSSIVFLLLEYSLPISETSLLRDALFTLFKIVVSFLLCLPLAIYGLKSIDVWEKVKADIFSMLPFSFDK